MFLHGLRYHTLGRGRLQITGARFATNAGGGHRTHSVILLCCFLLSLRECNHCSEPDISGGHILARQSYHEWNLSKPCKTPFIAHIFYLFSSAGDKKLHCPHLQTLRKQLSVLPALRETINFGANAFYYTTSLSSCCCRQLCGGRYEYIDVYQQVSPAARRTRCSTCHVCGVSIAFWVNQKHFITVEVSTLFCRATM